MHNGKTILQSERFGLMIMRLCHEIMERNEAGDELYLIGIQTGGVLLAERIYDQLQGMKTDLTLKTGKLDITFYRDDYRRRKEPLQATATELDFLIEGKSVILLDDVLYTGRTIQAAMSAIQSFGRPARVELMVLVDRRFNRQLPIRPDYIGIQVDTPDESYVRVYWQSKDKMDKVRLYSKEISV